MLSSFYKKTLTFVVVILALFLLSYSWGSLCTKTAVRIYYGKKSQWDRVYLVTNMEENNLQLSAVITSFYDAISSPTVVTSLTIQECKLNKCKPDMIVSSSQQFIEEAIKIYPTSELSSATINHIISGDGMVNKSGNIASISIWKKDCFISITKTSKQKTFISLMLKTMSANNSVKNTYEMQKIIEIQRKKQESAKKKIDFMRTLTERKAKKIKKNKIVQSD